MSIFSLTCISLGLPTPMAEYRFDSVRRWRIDYAFPSVKLAVEIEGGVWKKDPGRHNRASGFIKDMEKYNALASIGWVLLRYQPSKIDYNQIAKTFDYLAGQYATKI